MDIICINFSGSKSSLSLSALADITLFKSFKSTLPQVFNFSKVRFDSYLILNLTFNLKFNDVIHKLEVITSIFSFFFFDSC